MTGTKGGTSGKASDCGEAKQDDGGAAAAFMGKVTEYYLKFDSALIRSAENPNCAGRMCHVRGLTGDS